MASKTGSDTTNSVHVGDTGADYLRSTNVHMDPHVQKHCWVCKGSHIRGVRRILKRGCVFSSAVPNGSVAFLMPSRPSACLYVKIEWGRGQSQKRFSNFFFRHTTSLG